jgi:hypothetical protein
MSLRKDEALLSTLMQLPSVEAIATMVRQLHPTAVKRLCAHLKKIVHQARSHRIEDSKSRNIVSASLQPHAKLVKRITRKQKGRGHIGNLRSQKGGALISILLASVVPLLAQMAISAIIGKKKTK